MSEITPNTPNPVREDAYVEELAEKLGIDPQYIPKSPVWRNEEEIKALAEMFSNMAGGGVLVVTLTQNDGGQYVANKTAGEIYAATSGGGWVTFHYTDSSGADTYDIMRGLSIDETGYYISTVSDMYLFSETADGYPATGNS